MDDSRPPSLPSSASGEPARAAPRDAAANRARLVDLLHEQFSPAALQVLGPGAYSAVAYSEAEQRLWQEALCVPLARFLSRPGKALRAGLVDKSYQIAGGRGQCPELLGLLVEVLHAGSLIVDDIEDASEERRGGPTLHLEVGLPIALNAGNWLYFWAFALLDRVPLAPHVALAAHRWLSRTLLACHYGQALDLGAAVGEVEQRRMLEVVASATRFKTGCLMELCAALGALAAGARAEHVRALGDFGLELGMALQMLDDHSGLTNARRQHKGIEDLERGRPTWLWAWVAQSSSPAVFSELQRVARAVRRAPGAADVAPATRDEANALAARFRTLLGDSGLAHVRDHNRAALERLAARLGPAPAAQAAALVRELEQGYG